MITSTFTRATEPIELETILDVPNRIVLIDESARCPSNSALEDLYGTTGFDQFSARKLEGEAEAIEEANHRIMAHPNARTVQQVLNEAKRYLEIISHKINDITKSQKFHPRKGRRFSDANSAGENAIRRLQDAAFQGCRLIRESLIEPEIRPDSRYDILTEMIKIADLSIGLRAMLKDAPKYSVSEKKTQSETDLRLCAMAFYLSMFSDKSPAILTADTDFVRLMGIVPKLMGANEFSYHNMNFRKSLALNPVSVYLRQGGKYVLPISTSTINCGEEFNLNNHPENKETARSAMGTLWKSFSAQTPAQ